jgi:hypothetical protein
MHAVIRRLTRIKVVSGSFSVPPLLDLSASGGSPDQQPSKFLY